MRRTSRFDKFSPSQRRALDFSRNLVIRANAGSGKTSVLIERIVQILAHGQQAGERLSITDIAAITFTRKAAAELQGRLRRAFDEEGARSATAKEKAFWGQAVHDLPRAMIGTIDSLCGRILREFHWELHGAEHIDVDYQALDPYDQRLLQLEAIDRVINRSSEAAVGSPERAAIDWWNHREGFKQLTEHLLNLLNQNIEPQRIVAAHSAQPAIEERCRILWEQNPGVKLLRETRTKLQADLKEMLGILGPNPQTKTMVKLKADSGLLSTRLIDPGQDERSLGELSEILLTADREPRKLRNYAVVAPQFQALQETWASALKEPLPDMAGEAHAMQAADHLAALLGPVQAEYLGLCREANRYDFQTLARRARQLLHSSSGARSALKKRYRFVMVDEFQDTNPLQWEILSYIVGAGPDGYLDRDRLCIVGDPQQSIFRFRQADVRVFQQAQAKITESNREHGVNTLPMVGDDATEQAPSTLAEREGTVALAENYRSLSPLPLLLMDEVYCHAFDPIVHGLDPDTDTFEIKYQALEAGIRNKSCGEVRYIYSDDQEVESAEDGPEDQEEESSTGGSLVVAQVEAVAAEFLKLWGAPRLNPGESDPDTLRWQDMAVLLPSRTETLTELERAFRRRRIPFVVFGGIGFWQRQEIRDLVSLASWLADPGDELSLFVVLRSPIVQLDDSEIFFLSQLGRGNLWRGLTVIQGVVDDLPDTSELPRTSRRAESAGLGQALQQTWRQFTVERREAMREAARRLERWRQRTDRLGHADLLQRALEESGAYALYAALPEGEQILANQRQFFDQIRVEEAQSALGLSRLARRLRLQIDEFDKQGQADVNTGDDAVQIMTVHSAKGLEFPVVAVLKMEGDVARASSAGLVVQEEGPGGTGIIHLSVRHPYRPLQTFSCQGLRRLRELDKRQQIAEKRRLFYVAGTRASERLILAGGATKAKQTWQGWFEQALNIEESHRQAGCWEHPRHGWRVTIVRSGSMAPLPALEWTDEAAPSIDLEPILEESQSRVIGATQLEALRHTAKLDAQVWDLRFRLHLNPSPQSAARAWQQAGELTAQERGSLIGQLVHRMLAAKQNPLRLTPAVLEQRLRFLAAALLERYRVQEGSEENNANRAELEQIAGKAFMIFQRLRKSDAAAKRVCELMQAPGKTEVPFTLKLNRWLVRGRFDKLVSSQQAPGYALIDWKTGTGAAQGAAERYHPQMQLYALALALARTGHAARLEEGVQVQLVFLETAEIVTTFFNDETLRAFSSNIDHDLESIDDSCDSLKVAGRAVPRESDGR
jgi:ATP-dependent helicase/nuclease subunit A